MPYSRNEGEKDMRTFYPEHAILSYMYLLERMPNAYMALQNKDENA